MASDETDKIYRVGNKRPPKHSQFRRGRSGNPSGRPKGSKGLKAKIREQLQEPVTVTRKGKVIKTTKEEVIALQLVEASMRGDAKTALMLLRLTTDDVEPMAAGDTGLDLGLPDKEALKRISARLLRQIEED